MKKLNREQLQQMYPAMDEAFESRMHSMIHALPSRQEEEPVKKFTFRTALIAALIIMAMMAVAIAAANVGLTDWFQRNYHATLPQSAQEILQATEKTTLDAGPVTFTVNELLCDGKIAYMTAEARLKEAGSAILFPNSDDVYGYVGEALARQLNHPDVNAKTNYLDAARITGLPLYGVSAWMDMQADVPLECEMLDGYTTEDGSMMLVRMAYFMENHEADELPVTLCVQAQEIDPSTTEYKQDSKHRSSMERKIPINGVVAEKRYTPENPAKLSGCFSLTEVIARQTCAGVYVTICTELDAPMTMDEFLEINDEWDLLDATGSRWPTGASLTGEYMDGNGESLHGELPEDFVLNGLQYMQMISADELPAAFTVTDGTVKIDVK